MMMMIIRVFHGSSGVGSREERLFKNFTPSRQFRQEFSKIMKLNISLIISALFQLKKKKLTRILLSGEHPISNHASINYSLIISDQ